MIHTPPGAPRANATAERFVRTARTELLDRTLIWNERQLRKLIVEYLDHYNDHRPHRGINQNSPTNIDHESADPVPIDPIRRQRILDGLVNEYHHAARPATQQHHPQTRPTRLVAPNPSATPRTQAPINASIEFPAPTPTRPIERRTPSHEFSDASATPSGTDCGGPVRTAHPGAPRRLVPGTDGPSPRFRR